MCNGLTDIMTCLIRRENLTRCQVEKGVDFLLQEDCEPVTIAAFLTAMAVKGETAEELAGIADAIRKNSSPVELRGKKAIDLAGTGGDSLHTINVSTAAAFVVAGAGLTVAKHGNRSVSSRCGSADVLESLGVRLNLSPEEVEQAVDEIGIAFIYAPQFHSGLGRIGKIRKQLGYRTIFNLVGPLVNPSAVSCLLVGVYSPVLTELFADVLCQQGVDRAMVVCGFDGMDELSVSGPSRVTMLEHGKMTTSNFYPELYFEEGRVNPAELTGGDVSENAAILKGLLSGKITGGKKNIVLLNAGAALYIGGKAETIQTGIDMARESLETGKAKMKLEELIRFTHECSNTMEESTEYCRNVQVVPA